jgi:hypothetical protein
MAPVLTTYSDKPLPKLPVKAQPEWGTWVATRSPQWKVHTNIGHAKNAISSSGHGLLYRFMELEWTCVAIVDETPRHVGLKDHPMFAPGYKPINPAFLYTIQEEP